MNKVVLLGDNKTVQIFWKDDINPSFMPVDEFESKYPNIPIRKINS